MDTGSGNQGLPYDAVYYRQHCGPIPYGRTQPWIEFFGHAADTLIRSLNPRTVFDAGCAWGLLVEAFRDRGVDAWGSDISAYAIGKVRADIQPYCREASLTAPIQGFRDLGFRDLGFYDLITCIEVLEHMPEDDGNRAIWNLCRATDTILFSSTPSDFSEPTHVNVRPTVYWLQLFARQGFAPDLTFDASFVSPHAFLLRRRTERLPLEALKLFSEKLRIQAELAQAERRLKEVYASPGWRLIQRYRDWLSSNRARRPWLFKPVEALARWFLRKSAGRSAAPALPVPVAAIPVPTVETPLQPEASAFSYADWILEQEPDDAGLAAQRELAAAFSYQPKISIVVPVYEVPFEIVEQMIASVVGQTYGNWELCVAHADPAAAAARQHIASLAEADQRVKVSLLDENGGISRNSNEALALATGDFIGLLDHDDILAPFALFEIAKALNEQPSIDFLYSDRDEMTHVDGAAHVTTHRVNPLLKPQWSPEILLSANYLTHFSVIAAEHIRAIGGWREETDGAQDWDLFLRAMSRVRNVHHIPKILYHWRQIGTSVAGGGLAAKPYAEQAQLRTVQDHCRRQGWNADVEFDAHRRLRISWKRPAEQKISLILFPAAGGQLDAQTLPAGVEIVVPEGASLVEKICRAVERSTGEILVFVDQSVSPAGEDWLGELVGPLQNREIGIVGAKMLKPGTAEIHHAGIVFTEGNRLEYIFAGEFEDLDAEFGAATWYRDWSAVSGACFSMRREVWEAAGGFSRALQYPRLDVDLCLRVRFEAGLRVVYNPFARFYQTNPAALETWQWSVGQEVTELCLSAYFPNGDPYFHSRLTCRDGKVRLRSRAGFAQAARAWRGRSG